jgi:hypothetical protein
LEIVQKASMQPIGPTLLIDPKVAIGTAHAMLDEMGTLLCRASYCKTHDAFPEVFRRQRDLHALVAPLYMHDVKR